MGNLLSFTDTAQKLKVSKAQLSKLINGKVPGLPRLKIARLGRRVLVREEVLDQWVQEVELCNAGSLKKFFDERKRVWTWRFQWRERGFKGPEPKIWVDVLR
jgi:hypothetical protein